MTHPTLARLRELRDRDKDPSGPISDVGLFFKARSISFPALLRIAEAAEEVTSGSVAVDGLGSARVVTIEALSALALALASLPKPEELT